MRPSGAHRDLFKHVVDDELVDDAVVALGKRSGGEAVGLDSALSSVDGDQLGLVVLVGAGGIDVELGRVPGVLAAEGHLLVALAYIKSVLEMKLIVLAVDIDDAVATNVDDSKLAAGKEILSLQGVDRLKLQSLRDGHDAAIYETVVHRVGHIDFVGLHHLVHKEMGAQLLVVIVFHVVGMAGVEHLIARLRLHR